MELYLLQKLNKSNWPYILIIIILIAIGVEEIILKTEKNNNE